MTPERAREIAEGYGNDTKGMTEAILAACAEERLAALAEKTPAEEQRYGCHCDLEPGMQPDSCVLDDGCITDCTNAMILNHEGKGRDDCEYWQPIVFDK